MSLDVVRMGTLEAGLALDERHRLHLAKICIGRRRNHPGPAQLADLDLGPAGALAHSWVAGAPSGARSGSNTMMSWAASTALRRCVKILPASTAGIQAHRSSASGITSSASWSRTSASMTSGSGPRSMPSASSTPNRSSSAIGPRTERTRRTAATIASPEVPDIAQTLPARTGRSRQDTRVHRACEA